MMDGPATTIKAWSATMAMMSAVLMASAGVHTIAQSGGEAEREKGTDWAQSLGFSSGLSEGMCNFRVGNWASEPNGWSFSLIGA